MSLVLADWRNPTGEYPPPNAPLKRWAWEFLRRYPEYQDDFARLHADRRPSGRGLLHDEEVRRYRECGLVLDKSGDEVLGGALVDELESKWGLQPVADPTRADAWRHFHFKTTTIRFIRPGQTLSPSSGPSTVAIVFDVAFSIDAQLERARIALSEGQRRTASIHTTAAFTSTSSRTTCAYSMRRQRTSRLETSPSSSRAPTLTAGEKTGCAGRRRPRKTSPRAATAISRLPSRRDAQSLANAEPENNARALAS